MNQKENMHPLYFEVDNHLPLMIVPESEAHIDGHPVLTYSYAIYKVPDHNDQNFTDIDRLLTTDKNNHPYYMGTLKFEQPGKLFSYEADGRQELPNGAIQEIIEQLTHYRENPALWML